MGRIPGTEGKGKGKGKGKGRGDERHRMRLKSMVKGLVRRRLRALRQTPMGEPGMVRKGGSTV